NDEEKLYFVVESKGTSLGLDIRISESSKIACAIRHFEEISTKITVVQEKNFEGFSEHF
ncbi:MAG: hypothetical protein GXO30_03675, partial [Epsilonproteobacteria bacterium]|nr:hypothetical protein [Campylobacterota bacterium]